MMMLRVLQILRNTLLQMFLGNWWLAANDPALDLSSPMVDEPSPPAKDPTDTRPLPPPCGIDKPPCAVCGDHNLSLKGDRCVLCRAGI